MDKNSKLLKLGIGGTIVAALGCFTPIFLILLGVVGLSAFTGYLDYVLFPALALFVGITIYALRKRRRAQACRTTGNSGEKQ